MMPDDETKVIPPSSTDASRFHPSSRPAINPGGKLSRMSMTIPQNSLLRLLLSSSPVYSSPNMKSSKRTPTSAPNSMKLLDRWRGASPPFPQARPPRRKREMDEIPQRLATRASTASPMATQPSSMNSSAT